jgi:hypothetical protein
VLIDMDMGTKDDFLACLRMTFDQAHADGTITRPVELVVKEAIGLPRLEAKNTIDGYRELVEQGVLCTIGPLITDNSIALAPVIDRTGVPAITWTGTDRYFGDYCFNLGNGGLAEEAAIMATWIRASGYKTVGMIHEISPGGVEYASNFRWYAAKEKLDVLIEAYTTQVPDDLEGVLRKIRDQKPDCLAYLGYGYPDDPHGARCGSGLGWDPPRVMTTAFQFCYAKPEWMAALEGWVGVDQWCEDNPLAEPVFDRFAAATGQVEASHGAAPHLRHRAARRRRPRAREPAHAEGREGGAREGAHAVRRERRPAHAHEPRAVRPQGVQGRLARAAEDRERPHGLGRPARPGEDDAAGSLEQPGQLLEAVDAGGPSARPCRSRTSRARTGCRSPRPAARSPSVSPTKSGRASRWRATIERRLSGLRRAGVAPALVVDEVRVEAAPGAERLDVAALAVAHDEERDARASRGTCSRTPG